MYQVLSIFGMDDKKPRVTVITHEEKEVKETVPERWEEGEYQNAFVPLEFMTLYNALANVIRLDKSSTVGWVANSLFGFETDIKTAKRAMLAITEEFTHKELSDLGADMNALKIKLSKSTQDSGTFKIKTQLLGATCRAMYKINHIYNSMPNDYIKGGSDVSPLLFKAITHYNSVLKEQKFASIGELPVRVSEKCKSVFLKG